MTTVDFSNHLLPFDILELGTTHTQEEAAMSESRALPTSPPRPDPKRAARTFISSLPNVWQSESKQLIRMAIEAGCRPRKTANGHVLLVGPNGETTTVSPTGLQKGNRAHLNAQGQVGRLVASLQNDGAVSDEIAEQVLEGETLEDALDRLKEYRCELCKPPRQFTSTQALEDHRAEFHIKCELLLPDGSVCGQWLKTGRSKGPHYQITHEGKRPWDHVDHVAAEAAKKKKRAERELAAQRNSEAEKALRHVSVPQVVEEFTELEAPQPVALDGKRIDEALVQSSGPKRMYRGPSVKLAEAEEKLRMISEVLGGDEQVEKLTAQLEEANRRVGELEAKLQLMREAFQGL